MKNTNRSFYFVAVLGVAAIGLVFLAPTPKYSVGFENIDEIVAEANSKEEMAQPEKLVDVKRASWKTYHSKTQPCYWGRKFSNTFSLLGLKGRPNWSPSYFSYLLDARIKDREARGFVAEHVVKIVPAEKSRFIVWGDLLGAFHSVTRALQKLIGLGILDKDLKLVSKDDYFVFTGDAALRSPFIMELLTVIMKLDERNPDHILYVAGNNERDGMWYTCGLREELETKAPEEADSLFKKVDRYFNTLPLAVYVQAQANDFVRFSHFDMEAPSDEAYRKYVELLDDAYYSKKLLEANTIIKLSKERLSVDPTPVQVKVIVKALRKAKDYQKSNGLRLLVPDKSATAWTLMSCPTVFTVKYLDFWYDAFVIVQAASRLEDWTITLYSRDLRTKDDFATTTYGFLSGEKQKLVGNQETKINTNEVAP